MTTETDKGREALVGRLTCFAGITPSAPPPYEGNSFLNEHARGLIEEAIAALSTRTPSTGTGAREIEEGRLRGALEAILDLCDGEIRARWGGNNSMSIEQAAKGSRIYPLLVLPRNLARAALSPATPKE